MVQFSFCDPKATSALLSLVYLGVHAESTVDTGKRHRRSEAKSVMRIVFDSKLVHVT